METFGEDLHLAVDSKWLLMMMTDIYITYYKHKTKNTNYKQKAIHINLQITDNRMYHTITFKKSLYNYL